jgi:1-aminocyclopropane-1-carboxylate deaminase
VNRNTFDFLPDVSIPSPIQEVEHPLLHRYGVALYIKRDDLIHEVVSGNKYRKLKYNLIDAHTRQVGSLATFGGPFSNHLYAFAAACRLMEIACTGFVRGDIDPCNPTLKFCLEQGMTLIPVPRQEYRQKENSPFVRQILNQMQSAELIPEGGTNALAMKGAGEILEEIREQMQNSPDSLVLSAGTGGTAAGLLKHLPRSMTLIVFSALKSTHLHGEILQLARPVGNSESLSVHDEYHFGGYGKMHAQLSAFIDEFEGSTGIPLDPVYTGKAMFGLFEEIKRGNFRFGSRILFLHTGGLQGKKGLEYLRQNKKTMYLGQSTQQ